MNCPVRGCAALRGPAGALCFEHFGQLTLRMKLDLELSYLGDGQGRSALGRLTNDAVVYLEGRGLHCCSPHTKGCTDAHVQE